MKGYWILTFNGFNSLDDKDMEHIAEQIKDGFTEGELYHEEVDLLLCTDCTLAAVNDDGET